MQIIAPNARKSRIFINDFLIAFFIFLFSLCVYIQTLTPSLSSISPDGSELATIPAVLGLAHMPGYPLYTWLGYIFSQIPLNDVAFRMNLMSAVFASLGCAGLYLILIFINNKNETDENNGNLSFRSFTILSVLLFAFSKDFWSQALIAEVYAVNLGLIILTLLALQQWDISEKNIWYFLFALLYSFSFGTHLSNLGFAPAFIVFTLMSKWQVIKDWKWWCSAIGGFGLGFLQFLWLPFKANTLNDRFMLRSM